MQKLIVIGIIVMMITGCSVAANAYVGVALNVRPVADIGSYHTPQVGWLTDISLNNTNAGATTDGTDTSDYADSGSVPSGVLELDDVNSGIGSRVQYDYRAPITNLTQTEIWRFKATVSNPDASGQYIGASFGLECLFALQPTNQAFYILNGNFSTLAAVQTAIGYNGTTHVYTDTGTAILACLVPAVRGVDHPKDIAASTGFTSAAGAYSLGVPIHDEGEDTWSVPSKYFTVFALQVPEPGSLLAMFSGLIGLVGFGIRRRK
jgi:hypothetical protein